MAPSLANVSRVTVTRVLNEPDKVKEETRIRVEEAIKTLNYTPNLSARSLVSKSSGVIGMLVPDNISGFFGSVMSAVHKQVNAKGKMLMVLESTGASEEENALRKLDEINCDGFLLYVRHLSTEKIKTYTRSKPVVLLDAAEASAIAAITFGHYQAAFDATRKLTDAGHRHIAVVGGPASRRSAIARLNGCVDAIRQVNDGWDLSFTASGSYGQEFGEAATLELIGRKPEITAIVYCGERACSGGLRGLRTLGKNAPEDISIISFDSFGLTQYLAPHIDSVIYPVKEMAEYGVSEVLNQLFHKDYAIRPKEFAHYFIAGDSIRPC
ncbi:LacI family DNA-binding transcriptional regulator [Phytobacter sp. V91]|uniref:LacI family DNA-binding transcriptional regulator n=1 Tax=Phytobacter sp. V91 TaxID=3369425 RepID=UPI003F5E45AE